MANLRDWLTKAGFNWDTGKIILQYRQLDQWECFSDEIEISYGYTWNPPTGAEVIDNNHPVLDLEFSNDFGAAACPRIIAEDEHRLYFPGQYDGSTWLETVEKDITKYLDFKNFETPYPGG